MAELEALLDLTLPFAEGPAKVKRTELGDLRRQGALWRWEHDGGKSDKTGKSSNVGSFKGIYYSIDNNNFPHDSAHAHHTGPYLAKVCERVTFESIKLELVIAGRRRVVKLPVSGDFLARSYIADDVHVSGDGPGVWRLKMELESAAMLVLGYTVSPSFVVGRLDLGNPQVIDALAADSACGLEQALRKSTGILAAPSACDKVKHIRVKNIQVVVCLCLGFSRKDWLSDPKGGTGVARLLPHVMVLMNVRQARDTRITTAIHIERPANSTKLENGEDVVLSHPGMKPPIRPLLVADTNRSLPLTSLNWDDIFDYYDANPVIGKTYVITDPDLPEQDVGDSTCIEFENRREPSFLKLCRQGQFDNLHISPRAYFTLAEWLATFAGASEVEGEVEKLGRTLDDVAMAPVCAHDCLHTHWRWGREQTASWVRGWSRTEPYARAGAPMVPPNQRVELVLTSPSSFRTTITSRGPVAGGTWQVFNQNGSTYPLDWRTLVSVATGLTASWREFYWKIRYVVDREHNIDDTKQSVSLDTPVYKTRINDVRERIRVKDMNKLIRPRWYGLHEVWCEPSYDPSFEEDPGGGAQEVGVVDGGVDDGSTGAPEEGTGGYAPPLDPKGPAPGGDGEGGI